MYKLRVVGINLGSCTTYHSETEMAHHNVVLEATTYTKIYGQQWLGKCWCGAGSQPTWLFHIKVWKSFVDI